MANKNTVFDDSITIKSVELQGAKMQYLLAGEGEPILFLHGIPTWSYLWRNIIPTMAKYGQCIAPDLVGMGYSDKPDIDYTIFDHIQYIDAFIEAHIRPAIEKDMVALPVQERASILQTADSGYDVIMNSNYHINKVLPAGVMRKLSTKELEQYQAPFKEPGSAKPIWPYLQDLPMGEEQTAVLDLIETYSQRLQQSNIPKLMIYAMPGFNTSMDTVAWAKQHLPNLDIIEIDDALHYVPESHPDEVAAALVNWYQGL